MDKEKQLQQFREKAREAFGAQLKAILVYGSMARGEFDEGRSDVNLLVLVEPMDVAVLGRARKLFEWWLEFGYSWPLLFTPEELGGSGDAFPMELMDIAAAHRVIEGDYQFEAPRIDPNLHRAQLEHELRSKVLRLRQKAILAMGDGKALLRLMEESVSTFLVLLRHALIARGLEAPRGRLELIALAEAKGFVLGQPFRTILDLRVGAVSPKSVEPVQLFEEYLSGVQSLTRIVDQTGQ